MADEKKHRRGGKKEEPSMEELEFIYERVQRLSDREILEEMQDADFRLRSLGFIKRRRTEFNAAKKVLGEQARRSFDPLVVERRREHWDRLRELAGELKAVLFVPDLSQLYIPEVLIHTSTYSIPGRLSVGRYAEPDGAKIRATLDIEEKFLFPSLLAHLKAEFVEFNEFEAWKEQLNELVIRCHELSTDIFTKVDELAGVDRRSDTGVIGAFPRFIYEFVLRNAGREAAVPDVEMRSLDGMPILTPKGQPSIVLAAGTEEDINRYQDILFDQVAEIFLSEPSVDEISKILQCLGRWNETSFQPPLSLVIERGTFKNTKECPVCEGWYA